MPPKGSRQREKGSLATSAGTSLRNNSNDDSDEADMIRLGKSQRTKRNFGLISMCGFTTVMLCSWETAYALFLTGFINGGGITLIYGFIFCWLGSLATCASISEMASMYPTSGGQYHWVALLAPAQYAKFLSWLTGWVSAIGWQAGATAGIYLSGTIVQGLLVLNYPNYGFQRWHGTLLMYAVLVFSLVVNTVGIRFMPFIETFVLVLHIVGFFAVLIPLVRLTPHRSSEFVFRTFVNESGYADGLAWFVGLVSTANIFVGFDGAAHMAEEVKHASINVPRSMMFTVILNGILGLATFIGLLYCLGDIDAAVKSPTGWPFMEIFYSATRSVAGTTAMTSVLIALFMSATLGYLASASRELWAFARDRGVPFHSTISHVNRQLAIPLSSIGISAIIIALLGLINIGSIVAFNAIISLVNAGLFSSYLITLGVLIRKRFVDEPISFGPWHLGKWGLPINLVAFVYTLIVMVVSFFPPSLPVTSMSMNWSCVVYGGIVIFGLIYYSIWGRHDYHGPVIEREMFHRQR